MDGAPAYGQIVVGVDGSPTSRVALRWAAREAQLRHCALEVVYGWQVKAEPRPPGEWGGVAPPIEAYQEQAQARIEGIVGEVLPNGAKCEMNVHAMHKPAGRALLKPGSDSATVSGRSSAASRPCQTAGVSGTPWTKMAGMRAR